ncbi:hypothetical protein Tam1G_1617 [Bifidobacterium imperatoris]|uniref:Uncharacterized protein n=1 Tax=Bifidobacterium imperatoris TaxID=2020965 RepID=A0A2N5IQW7_9BIFI|nr:hypothetical protein Tam1G_1617 [Bifidobacterium imperatoris]
MSGRSLSTIYKSVLTFCTVFVGLIFTVMGFWELLGVVCLCTAMVLAGVPERVHGAVNRGES